MKPTSMCKPSICLLHHPNSLVGPHWSWQQNVSDALRCKHNTFPNNYLFVPGECINGSSNSINKDREHLPAKEDL